jgi:hypothetical protein
VQSDSSAQRAHIVQHAEHGVAGLAAPARLGAEALLPGRDVDAVVQQRRPQLLRPPPRCSATTVLYLCARRRRRRRRRRRWCVCVHGVGLVGQHLLVGPGALGEEGREVDPHKQPGL